MKLEKVREIKAQLLKDLADVEVAENEVVEAEFTKYADRLIALMNRIEKGSDFCISFIPKGETERVNVLPPTQELGVKVLRDLALSAVITRLDNRAAKDNVSVAIVMDLVPTEDD